MADALVLTLCRGNFWDHEFRSMLSWFHLQKSVLNLRVICQEAGLGIYFPGGGVGVGGGNPRSLASVKQRRGRGIESSPDLRPFAALYR